MSIESQCTSCGATMHENVLVHSPKCLHSNKLDGDKLWKKAQKVASHPLPLTPNDTEIDDTVATFYERVFEHAFKLGQEFPDEKVAPHDPCNAEDKLKLTQALSKLIDKARLEELQEHVFGCDGKRATDRIKELKAQLTDKVGN